MMPFPPVTRNMIYISILKRYLQHFQFLNRLQHLLKWQEVIHILNVNKGLGALNKFRTCKTLHKIALSSGSWEKLKWRTQNLTCRSSDIPSTQTSKVPLTSCFYPCANTWVHCQPVQYFEGVIFMWGTELTKYQLSQKQTIFLRSPPKKLKILSPTSCFNGNFLT